MLFAVALLLATPPVPMGVNDSILGKPEDFAFAGPGTVCADSFTYGLAADETVYLSYSGIHNFTLVTIGPSGTLEIALGEINGEPKGEKSLVLNAEDKAVYRIRSGGRRYLVYNRFEHEVEPVPGGPLIELKGSALKWNEADMSLVSRLKMGHPKRQSCDVTYNYGWGVLLDGDPFIVRKSESK